eukprot:scaffold72791_cov26-Tisochrysis_lutea.AAC.4
MPIHTGQPLTFLNRSATCRSDSPTHFESNSGPLTAKKEVRASAARAFAARVLEQPGGPYSRIPRGGRIARRAKASAWRNGQETASRRACLSSSDPPMSDHDTLERCAARGGCAEAKP